MLDNMLTSHARMPFTGPRKIVVAMGEMMSARPRLAHDPSTLSTPSQETHVRIVHVVERFDYGGLQTVVMDLCEAQRKSGHFVEIAVREGSDHPRRRTSADGRRGGEIAAPFRVSSGPSSSPPPS